MKCIYRTKIYLIYKFDMLKEAKPYKYGVFKDVFDIYEDFSPVYAANTLADCIDWIDEQGK